MRIDQDVGFTLGLDATEQVRVVTPGVRPFPLQGEPPSMKERRVRWRDAHVPFSDVLSECRTAGLLVLQGNRVILEEYGLGHSRDTPWNGFSMAKLVLPFLYGVAVHRGLILNLDAPVVHYVPRLIGTAYGTVSLRHLLTMSTGVVWMESYSHPRSHASCMVRISQGGTMEDLIELLSDLPRIRTPGEVYNYNSAEAYLAGEILRIAVGANLSDFLSETIWKPFGMASPAYWRVMGGGGTEQAGTGFLATLRDWGRLGLLGLRNGRGQESDQLFSEGWIAEAAGPGGASSQFGYLLRLDETGFFGAGMYGQFMRVSQEADLVVVLHSRWESMFDRDMHKRRVDLLQMIQTLGPAWSDSADRP